MYLTQPIHKGLRERPEAVAAICGSERISHATLAIRVARLAGALRALGVAPGDRVGILALNSIRYLELYYAAWWVGAVVNPINIRWSPAEVAWSLDDCDTRVLVVDDTFVPMVAALRERSAALRTVIHAGPGEPPEGLLGLETLLARADAVPDAALGGDALAAVMYTGGTTGQPKGVMLSHANLGLNALANLAAVSREGLGVGLVVTPMFHVAGCGLMLLTMLRQAPQAIVPVFDEPAVLAAIHEHRAGEVFLVPTMIRRLVEHPRFAEFDLTSLRLMLYGAAPIDAVLLETAMRALPRAAFAQAYGMTELAPTAVLLGPDEHRPGPDRERLLRAAGRPLSVAEVRVVDPRDRELPAGEVGEIAVRGPIVMKGYWNRPEESAEALRGGWMHTGDMGRFDENGYLYVVDRLKDMIVSGGENVYSAEVENVLALLPEVAQSAVIGVPDDRWGERVHAVVVLREAGTLDAERVIEHCRARVAGYKCPRSVEFRTELPTSAAGKLQKHRLREPYWGGKSRRVN